MLRAAIAPLLLLLASAALTDLGLVAHRPDASAWKRTQCGGPSGDAEIPSKWASEVSSTEQPLTAYPRPQMVRGSFAPQLAAGLRDIGDPATWVNLNGLWEWEAAASSEPRFGQALKAAILVPFPVESCLSGQAPNSSKDVVKAMWYRLSFDLPRGAGRTLLHFGAVDWQATAYLNGHLLGNHTGGFDGFSFDITDALQTTNNELLLYVYDPSDHGVQPNGKQRISSIDHPAGDQYTPSSGIWQTVWIENVPETYIQELKINQASNTAVSVSVLVASSAPKAGVVPIHIAVADSQGRDVAHADGWAGEGKAVTVEVPSPKLWSPDSPTLYDLRVSTPDDSVLAYFGLRTFVLGKAAGNVHPLLNGEYTFLAGFLDQSWWPDGQYTAPTDEALEYDLKATKMFGLNMIRLHQKVNPERWYYFADLYGLAVLQDMPQKYGGAKPELVPYFVEDMKRMIAGRGNHPCIVQWETFNEGDCWGVFNTTPYDVKGITDLAKSLDPTRLVDTDSGGGANNLHAADVNDIHSYPYPKDVNPSQTQYAMVGEFGGIGAFIKGKEWVPGKCFTYLKASTAADEADKYIQMAKTLQSLVGNVSASVYTQTTDVELECDGFLNYDRSNKFTDEQTQAIRQANEALIKASRQLSGQKRDQDDMLIHLLI